MRSLPWIMLANLGPIKNSSVKVPPAGAPARPPFRGKNGLAVPVGEAKETLTGGILNQQQGGEELGDCFYQAKAGFLRGRAASTSFT